jgi:HSP20 family protein
MVETNRSPHRHVDLYANSALDAFDAFFTSDWLPSVDVTESEADISVQAELPGLNPKDIDVNVSGNLLTIKGEKKTQKEYHDENYHRRERYSGAFQRRVHLPSDVKGEEAKARYQNGILSIRLPKAHEGKGRKIDIP